MTAPIGVPRAELRSPYQYRISPYDTKVIQRKRNLKRGRWKDFARRATAEAAKRALLQFYAPEPQELADD